MRFLPALVLGVWRQGHWRRAPGPGLGGWPPGAWGCLGVPGGNWGCGTLPETISDMPLCWDVWSVSGPRGGHNRSGLATVVTAGTVAVGPMVIWAPAPASPLLVAPSSFSSPPLEAGGGGGGQVCL